MCGVNMRALREKRDKSGEIRIPGSAFSSFEDELFVQASRPRHPMQRASEKQSAKETKIVLYIGREALTPPWVQAIADGRCPAKPW